MNLYERVTKRPAADWLFCWLTLGVSWVLTETFWCGWRTRCTAHHAECLFLLFTVPIFFFVYFFIPSKIIQGLLKWQRNYRWAEGPFQLPFGVHLYYFLILVFVKRLRVTAQTSFSDYIIICFLFGFGSICKQTRKYQGFLAVKREQGCIH